MQAEQSTPAFFGEPGAYELFLFSRYWMPERCYLRWDSACEDLSHVRLGISDTTSLTGSADR
jgi:hypothetical protein